MLAYSGCSRHDCTLRNANGYCSVTACRNPANSNGLTTYTTSYHEPQPSTNADKLREIIRKRISYHCDEREHDFRLGKDCVEPLINDIIRDIWLNQNEPEGGGGVMLKCLEFRHHEPPTIHPENEIVCWHEDGKTCHTVAVFRYNAHEPCWYLETVGDRIVGLDGKDFMLAVQHGFEYLNAAETEGTK